jgi:hypothetical protein
LELVGQNMNLLGKKLTPLTMMDQLLCISDGRGPIKPCSKSLANQSSQSSMVATGASIYLLQNLHPFFLRDALLKQFLLRVLTHKLPLDEYIVLATPDKAFYLNFVMGNIYRREIPYEWLSPVTSAGQNCGNQLVCEWLFSHMLFFLLDGWLHEVLDENSMENLCSG